MKTACIKCCNLRQKFYPFTNINESNEVECYASPKLIEFDPIYGENYIVGYNLCKDINTGNCEMFAEKNNEPIKSPKKWWQYSHNPN